MVEVKVRDKGMYAEVNVSPEEDEVISAEYIKNMLRLEGVQAGIRDSVIDDIVQNQRYGSFVTVAVGKEAVDGTDGKYDFHFVIPNNNKAPRILEDGSVDYTPAITNVNCGDLVAEYHPRTNGVFGFNVFATMLQPKKGRELSPLRCQGVRKEDNKYYAEKSGYITLKENQINIKDVLGSTAMWIRSWETLISTAISRFTAASSTI